MRVSNGLDPDQERYFVGPHLDPNCLQRLSADDKVAASKERVKLWRSSRHMYRICVCFVSPKLPG